MKKILSTLLMLGMSSLTFANSQQVVEQLQKMGLSGVEVSDSPVKGIKTAVTDNGIFTSQRTRNIFLTVSYMHCQRKDYAMCHQAYY